MTESDSESYDSLDGFFSDEEIELKKHCEVCYKSCTNLVKDRFCARCFNKDFIYGCVTCQDYINIKTDKYLSFIGEDDEYHLCWKCSENKECNDQHIRECQGCNINYFFDHPDFPKNQYNNKKLCTDCYNERREIDKENCSILMNTALITDLIQIIRSHL